MIEINDPPSGAVASLIHSNASMLLYFYSMFPDVNDNDPVFSPSFYEATMAEDQPQGKPFEIFHSNIKLSSKFHQLQDFH